MKKWSLSDVRWASEAELGLPFWSKFNVAHRPADWADAWEGPFIFSRVPASSWDHARHEQPSALPEFSYLKAEWDGETDVKSELDKLLSKTLYRAVITLRVGDEGMPLRQLRALEEYFQRLIPALPITPLRSSSSLLPRGVRTKKQENTRVLGMVIDARPDPRSIAILIPHWESPFFLRTCLTQILKRRNPCLEENVYVIDDMSEDGSFEAVRDEFSRHTNIHFTQVERADKSYEPNVGYLIDVGLSSVKEQYVATIDADLFPLSQDWLTFPIWAIETGGCSSVGMDTSFSTSYIDKFGGEWWQPKGDGHRGGYYDNDAFTVTNNLYRVMPTALTKVVSENIGFQRCRPRAKLSVPTRAWLKADWMLNNKLRKTFNPRWPYLPERCDNGVAANHFIDINHLGPKFNIPMTSYIGHTPKDGMFGQNISGLAFHYALSTRALSSTRREIEEAGEEFHYWIEKLRQTSGSDESMVEEMIAASEAPVGPGRDFLSAQWREEETAYIRSLVQKSREYFARCGKQG